MANQCNIHGCSEQENLLYDKYSDTWMCPNCFAKHQTSEPGRKEITGWEKYNIKHPENPVPLFKVFDHEKNYRNRRRMHRPHND